MFSKGFILRVLLYEIVWYWFRTQFMWNQKVKTHRQYSKHYRNFKRLAAVKVSPRSKSTFEVYVQDQITLTVPAWTHLLQPSDY